MPFFGCHGPFSASIVCAYHNNKFLYSICLPAVRYCFLNKKLPRQWGRARMSQQEGAPTSNKCCSEPAEASVLPHLLSYWTPVFPLFVSCHFHFQLNTVGMKVSFTP